MASKSLKIDKTLRPITLWVHPEGRVIGSIFVQPELENNSEEEPNDVLNLDAPFLVLQKQDPEEIHFYNRTAIIRAEYPKSDTEISDNSHTYHCKVMMMDGSQIYGIVQESLPSEYSRLYDYLNQGTDRFIKLHGDDETTYLVNKAYVTQVVSVDG